MRLPQVPGRPVRVLVGDSVYEDAFVTIDDNVIYVEFVSADFDDITLDLEDLTA